MWRQCLLLFSTLLYCNGTVWVCRGLYSCRSTTVVIVERAYDYVYDSCLSQICAPELWTCRPNDNVFFFLSAIQHSRFSSSSGSHSGVEIWGTCIQNNILRSAHWVESSALLLCCKPCCLSNRTEQIQTKIEMTNIALVILDGIKKILRVFIALDYNWSKRWLRICLVGWMVNGWAAVVWMPASLPLSLSLALSHSVPLFMSFCSFVRIIQESMAVCWRYLYNAVYKDSHNIKSTRRNRSKWKIRNRCLCILLCTT